MIWFSLFFENQTYEVVIEDKKCNWFAFFHENRYIREAVTYVGRSKVMSGLINFHNDIGLSQLRFGIGHNFISLNYRSISGKDRI